MKLPYLVTLGLVFATLCRNAACDHYKGGVFTSYSNTNDSINVRFQVYYKLETGPPCDDNIIQSGANATDGSTSSIRIDYCDSNRCWFDRNIRYYFKCLNFDSKNNWTQFENSIAVPLNFNLLRNADLIKFSIPDGGSRWSYHYWTDRIFFQFIHVNKLVLDNTPPNVISFPLFNFKCGCRTKFKPIIIDNDPGDRIKCRVSNSSLYEAGCGRLCTNLYSLNETTCVITFEPSVRRSFPIEIQVEDYNVKYMNGTQPMSSTAFQFNAVLTSCLSNPKCDEVPYFLDSLEPSGSCVAIRPQSVYKGRCEAYSVGNRISEIRIFKDFPGFIYNQKNLTFNSLTNTSYYDFNITQALNTSHTHTGMAIFESIDTNLATSEQHVINYVFNFEPPQITNINGLGNICYNRINSLELGFVFNSNISKPRGNNDAHILFVRDDKTVDFKINTYLMNNQIVANGFNVSIDKRILRINTNYHILFDFGVVIVDAYCGPGSEKVRDASRFRFSLVDDANSKVNFANTSILMRQNFTVEYELVAATLVACYLKQANESHYRPVACDLNKCDIFNYPTGVYSFVVGYRTVCNNLRNTSAVRVQVVNQSPVITYETKYFNGQYASARFEVSTRCSHPIQCKVYCRFESIEEPLGLDYQLCSSFKPNVTLKNGFNYSLDIQSDDVVGNKDQVKLSFRADTEAPTWVTFVDELRGNCGDVLESAPTVVDVFDPSPVLTHKDTLVTSCLIKREWTASDAVGNEARRVQTLVYESQSRLDYKETINMPCVDNRQVINDLKLYGGFIALENNNCNTSLKLTLSYPTLPSNDCDFTFRASWSVKDECNPNNDANLNQMVIVEQRQIPYSPLFLQEGVPIMPYFKWPVKRAAKSYSILLRNSSQDEKTTLLVSSTKLNEFQLRSFSLNENQEYYWNVVYDMNTNMTETSPSWSFKTKQLADLSVSDLTLPPDDSIPGVEFLVSWRVRNIGKAVTSSSLWYDYVYGGSVSDFQRSSFLGRVRQNRFLEPSGVYDSKFAYRLPERYTSSNFFIWVFIDGENSIEESNKENNIRMQIINVGRLKLPNLVIKSVTFNLEQPKAGRELEVRYVVENVGESATRPNVKWVDVLTLRLGSEIIWSTKVDIKMADPMAILGNYSKEIIVDMPEKKFAKNATFEVITNYNDALYELSTDDNSLVNIFDIIGPDTADLTITDVWLSESNLKTGELFSLGYRVLNEGIEDAVVQSWLDACSIKNSQGREVYSHTKTITGPLLKQNTYERTFEFSLGHTLTDGNYTVELSIDKTNRIFVYNPSSTSVRNKTSSIGITRSLPAWNLQSSSAKCVQVTLEGDKYNRIDIAYTLAFTYSANLSNVFRWTDEIYLSDRSVFNLQNSIKLGEQNRLFDTSSVSGGSGSLRVNESFLFKNDDLFSGFLYVYYLIDSDNLNEKVIMFTNPHREQIYVNKIVSNLMITYFRLSNATLEADSHKINVSIRVQNNGPRLIKKPLFNLLTKRALTQSWTRHSMFRLENDLPFDEEEYPMNTTISLDKTYSGMLYVTVAANSIFDFNLVWNDSSSISLGVEIEKLKSADLSVLSLNGAIEPVSLSGADGESCDRKLIRVKANYTVRNIGLSMEEAKAWTDQISVSCASITPTVRVSKDFRVANILKYWQNYTNTVEFMLENTLVSSLNACSIMVFVNRDDGLFEIFSKENNQMKTCCFNVPRRPLAKLTINLNANETMVSMNSGESIQLGYYFDNKGDGSTVSKAKWKDAFYLYNTSRVSFKSLLQNGILLAWKDMYSFELKCDSNSSLFNLKAHMPSSLEKVWHGFLVHDVEIVANSNELAESQISFNFTKSDPCDLMVISGSNSINSNESLNAGQTIKFSFQVLNMGIGKAKGLWYDAIYLSKFSTVQPTDIKLLTSARLRELNTNESYIAEFEMKIPISLKSGNYFLIMVADSLNVLDDSNKDNNQNYTSLSIEEQPPVDLSLHDLNMFSSAFLTFNWTLKSNIPVSKSERCDNYYMSLDNLYDEDDYEISTSNCESFSIVQINPNTLSEIRTSKTVEIPLIADGDYHGIVRSISSVPETNYDNNQVASNETVTVEVQTLQFDTEFIATIAENSDFLFKFFVDATINSFSIELTTKSQNAFHDLYVRNDKMPTQNIYKARSLNYFSFNQTLRVRNANPGVYYLLLKSFMGSNQKSNYDIALIVKEIKKVQIDSIYPLKLNLKGSNTVKITGNFEPKNLQVCLASERLPSYVKCTDRVYKKSMQEVFATFEFTDDQNQFALADIAYLTVNSIRSSVDLEIIEADLGSIKIDLKMKHRIVRVNQSAFATIELKNVGHSDAYVPIVTMSTFKLPLESGQVVDENLIKYFVVSLNNLPYYSLPYDHLYLFNHDGLGSLIQPAKSITITAEIRPKEPDQQGRCSFYIFYSTGENYLADLVRKKIDSFKIDIMTDQEWKSFAANFIRKASMYEREFFRDTVNWFSVQNIKTYRLDDLIFYHVNRLDNSFFEGDLVNSRDINLAAPGSDEIFFNRIYPARISKRNYKRNALCTGWTDWLNIKLRKIDEIDLLSLTVHGDQVDLGFKSSDGLYETNDFQIEYKPNANYSLIYWKTRDLILNYDIRADCLQEIRTADNKIYRVSCGSNGFINRLSSPQPYVDVKFSYSIRNCLTSISKTNQDGSNEQVLYTYDSLNRLISAIGPLLHETYEYDDRNNLVKVKSRSGQQQQLDIRYTSEDNLVEETRLSQDNSLSLIAHNTYEYFNHGPIKVNDMLTNTYKIYFYDSNNRLVSIEHSGDEDLKFFNNMDENEIVQYYNGEMLQSIKANANTRMRTYTNIQGDEIRSSNGRIHDYNNNRIQFRYENKDNVEINEVTFTDNSTETQKKQNDDKRVTITTRKGDQLELEFDDQFNRIFYSHATGDENKKCYYDYGQNRLLKSAVNTDQSIMFDYDHMQRLVMVRSSSIPSTRTQYVYDEASNLVEIKINDNDFHIRYEYDASGKRLLRVKDVLTNMNITNIHYVNDQDMFTVDNEQDPYLHKFNLEPTLVLLEEYTAYDRAQPSIAHIKNVYAYDKNKRNTHITKTDAKKETFLREMFYDNTGRLIWANDNETDTVLEIKYDANGNRKEFNVRNASKMYTKRAVKYLTNNLNQYTENSESVFEYDTNGNLIREISKLTGHLSEYEYSPDGKLLRSVTLDDNCTYEYNCLERLSKMHCQKRGTYEFVYHYNQILFDKLSHVIMPNGTIAHFIHISTIAPSIEFTSVKVNTRVAHFPVVKPDNMQTLIEKPHSILDIPLSVNQQLPLIDQYTVLDLNNIPFSMDHNSFYGPKAHQSMDPYQHNMYSPNTGDLSGVNYRQIFDKFYPEPFNSGNEVSKFSPIEAFSNLRGLPNPCNWNIFGGAKSKHQEANFHSLIKKQADHYWDSHSNLQSNSDTLSNNTTNSRGFYLKALCRAVAAGIKEAKNNSNWKDILNSALQAAIPSEITDLGSFLCGNSQFSSIKDIIKKYIKEKASNKVGKIIDNLVPFRPAKECLNEIAPDVTDALIDEIWNWAESLDPNDIIGPIGIGNENYIPKEKTFLFRARFENMNITVAPAQVVKIESRLSAEFDLRTIQFTGYGFNEYENNFNQQKRAYINDRMKLPNAESQYEIRVFATVDLANSVILWKFTTIDKITGEVPDNAEIGFLPVRNDTHGEGYVEFEIKLLRSVLHLQQVTAAASIIFDNNEPIETNTLEYTIDAKEPELKISNEINTNFLLIEAIDSGSGIGSIRLYDNNQLFINRLTESTFSVFLEARSEPYLIYGEAEDNVGNKQALKFYLNLTVSENFYQTDCINNCSNNGVCSIYGICECDAEYYGDDCSLEYTLEELLMQPVQYTVSYFKAKQKDRFNFVIDFENETYPSYKVRIEISSILKYEDAAENKSVVFLYKNQSFTDELSVELEDSDLSVLTFEVITTFTQTVLFSLNLTSFRLNPETNQTLINSITNELDVYLETFLPEDYISLNTTGCYNFNENLNLIPIINDGLNHQDKIDILTVSVSFLDVRYSIFNESKVLVVKAEEIFDKVEVTLEMSVFLFNQNLTFRVSNQFYYSACDIPSSTSQQTSKHSSSASTTTDIQLTEPPAKKKGLSIGAIIGIAIGSVVAILIIVALIVFFTKQ